MARYGIFTHSLWLLCLTSLVADAQPLLPSLGRTPSKTMLSVWNTDIFPEGWGLPKGQGNAVTGRQVYQQYCQGCHGVEGRGASADELAGAQHGLQDTPPDKTIGTYWPYATTIFDFTRRTMPLDAPGTLNNDQLYAVTAYLLFINGIIGERDVMNAITLAKVVLPNREGFISVYSPD